MISVMYYNKSFSRENFVTFILLKMTNYLISNLKYERKIYFKVLYIWFVIIVHNYLEIIKNKKSGNNEDIWIYICHVTWPVEPGYKNTGLCDTSSIASYTRNLWLPINSLPLERNSNPRL